MPVVYHSLQIDDRHTGDTMNKYLQNLIDQNADPILIAKHGGNTATSEAASKPAETHGSATPAARRRTTKKAAK